MRELSREEVMAGLSVWISDDVERESFLAHDAAQRTRITELEAFKSSAIKGAEDMGAAMAAGFENEERLDDALKVAREAIEGAAEMISVARDRLGCCGEGDGVGRKADNTFPGSLEVIAALTAALAEIDKALDRERKEVKRD